MDLGLGIVPDQTFKQNIFLHFFLIAFFVPVVPPIFALKRAHKLVYFVHNIILKHELHSQTS